METISLPTPLTWIQPLEFAHKLGICERFFGKAIAHHGICWVDTGAGIPWKLDLRNPTHRWIVYGKYEGTAFLNWAKEFLPNNAIVVDSGANIGQMLIYLAGWIPEGKILAFEPGTEAAKWIEECLAINSSLPVEIIRAGLGASPTQLRLNYVSSGFRHGAQSQISETEGEVIQIVRLADELAARSLENVDLWKLDVEGYEIPALQGAESLLKQQRIKAIYAELHAENGQHIRDFFADFAYKCYLFDNKGNLYTPEELPYHTNGLFLPN